MAASFSGNTACLTNENDWMKRWKDLGQENHGMIGTLNMLKLKGNDIDNSQYFSAGHLIQSESVARFGSYSLNKALKPANSVNFIVLNDAAKPY